MSITVVYVTPHTEITDCMVCMRCVGEHSLHELEAWCDARCIGNKRHRIEEATRTYTVTVWLKHWKHTQQFLSDWDLGDVQWPEGEP